MNSTHSPSPKTPSQTGQPQQMRAGQLDPEAGAVLKVLAMGDRGGPVNRNNLARKRNAWRLVARALGRGGVVARIDELTIPGPQGPIELRVYHPVRPVGQTGPLPAFLWFHGGGFLIGGLTTADAVGRHVATASGAIVVTVRYRLAPEHDLYAGRDDCMAALEWAAREGAAHGIDGTRLAVGGDSAGANIAAAVAQRARAQGGPALRLQALVYPATNLRDPFPSKDENSQGFLLTAEGMEAIKELFCSANPDLGDPLLSPGLSKDLKNLPPAVIVTAGFDPIRDDGLNYVGQLRDAGVPVELLHYAGQFHGFINFDGVMRAARDALDRIGAALKQALQAMPEGKQPVALDRTLEIEQKPKVKQIPALSLGRNMFIASLMAGERLEGLRTDVMQRLLPKGGRLSAMWASPLMNPVTTYRAQVAQMYAAMDVRETYSGGAAGRTAPTV